MTRRMVTRRIGRGSEYVRAPGINWHDRGPVRHRWALAWIAWRVLRTPLALALLGALAFWILR